MALAAAVGLPLRRARAESAASSWESRTRQAVADLAKWAIARRARVSALVAQVSSGREIAAATPEEALNPASNQKLLTAAAALDVLGPAYRFTSLLAGRRSGDALSEIVLRSDGDPELSSADFGALVETLWARGHRAVSGDLWVDQSAFDAAWDPPGYEQRPNDWAAYRAPVSAVSVDRNAVTLYVAANERGEPARVWFEPEGLVGITGSVATSASGSAQNVRFTIRPQGTRLEALLGGSVPAGSNTLGFTRRIAAPELSAGYVLAAKLAARGIAFNGSVRAGGAEVRDVLAVHRSRPLAQIVHALGKTSDNFAAEMLLKALGRKLGGGAGSSASGALAVEAYLKRKGTFSAGMRVGNGSGLFDANRVSARSLVQVLVSTYADPRVGPELLASLAIGGVDGTLTHRFASLRADRSVRAKTGTLADVIALSGYVLLPAPAGTVAFSLLVNGVAGKTGEARQRIDAVVDAIARG